MSPDGIRATAELAWPLLAAVVLLAVMPALRRVLASRAFTIKFGDMELSVQDASEQLRRQIEDIQTRLQLHDVRLESAIAAPNSAAQRTILWVDDRPENNAYEITKLQDDGWEIRTVRSTPEALKWISERSARPDLVISDMGRREGLLYHGRAGLELIREMRARGVRAPILLYTAGDVDPLRAAVEQAGGNGITASPLELFGLVNTAARRG